MSARTAAITRNTAETQVKVVINLDCQPGTQNEQLIEVSTGIGFLDHASTHPLFLGPRPPARAGSC
jgi:imidazoleglycerol-phosphate dehydratase